ncbi:hypothetical protein CHLNCDRAFT_143873 [Chlorella variabilis]|uniref:Uncharacterized protein n=1 Tax=Chlorella variabilis TaxID=554065 RepID=E1ZAM6_CHLVA|nr:hypothetical protein CHLNCDRAFT_143873 [Chlorella variabilis]EFN57285.1 hypothetical protein CHLNCDRAFT_143873 [Chlorella variabilis]|eukprot:XP_005849387.1 hypothetical protein CHLNCDRAFT_143873 [Chlorella variabilis]
MAEPVAKKRRTVMEPPPPAHVEALPGPDAAQYEAFVASGRHVYSVAVPRGGAFAGERGKGGVYIAEAGAEVQAAPLGALQHQAEVQHLALHEQGDGQAVLASVDCYGRALLAQARRLEGQPGLHITGVHQLQPADVLREPGWAGVALAPGQPSQAAVARHFAKDVTLFDGPMAVQTIHTLYRPTAVQLLSTRHVASPGGGPLVAVAEGPQLSIWDVRGSKRGGRVAKLCPGPYHGHLYCIAAADDGGLPLIGAAGHERSVLVWEPRKWVLLDRWSNCLKYEATGMHFCSANPRLCYVAGMDYEVLCGEWGGNKASRLGGGNRAANNTHTGLKSGAAAAGAADAQGEEETAAAAGGLGRGVSFRGDSRWVGLGKAAGQDVLAGMTQSCQLYVAEFAAG